MFGFMYTVLIVFYAVLLVGKKLDDSPKRATLPMRFGWNYPRIEKGQRKLVWIHAVSVGETKAAAALLPHLKRDLGDPMIVVSSMTETGHAEAKRCFPDAAVHVYLPLDFRWITRRVLKGIRPDWVLITETDLWYKFLSEAKAVGAKIALVNGKVSERSAKRLECVPFFAKRLYGLLDLICAQSEDYRKRFIDIGVPDDRITVTGNLKFDASPNTLDDNELHDFRQQLGLNGSDPVLVIGSTHDPEEKLLIPILKTLWEDHPTLRVILVPRHPERFDAVASLLKEANISCERYSTRSGIPSQVVLVDAMGLLNHCYQIADVALVAGSYTVTVGGHNILEPMTFGISTLYGPEMHSQPELLSLAKQYNSGLQLPINQLADAVSSLLKDPTKRQELGNAGKALVKQIYGSSLRTAQALNAL